MNRTIAKTISYILHPLIMPTFGVIYLFYNGSYVSFMPMELKKIILLVIAANTFALPLLIIPLFYHFGVIRSINMETNKERIYPIAFTLIPYIFSVYFIFRIPIPNVIGSFVLGATITLLLALLITFFWKISLHMLGIGGITGFLLALSFLYSVNVYLPIAIFIILSGILATARLSLSSHKPSQIYIGFIAGAILMFIAVSYL